jgi:hypothetical protein
VVGHGFKMGGGGGPEIGPDTEFYVEKPLWKFLLLRPKRWEGTM